MTASPTAGRHAVATVSDEVLLARAYLSRVAEPASVPLWRLVRDVGPVEAADRIRRQDGISEAVRGATSARHLSTDPHADLEVGARRGIRFVVPESPDWPHFGLSALEHAAVRRDLTYDDDPSLHRLSGEPMPPVGLWVAGPGDLATLGTRSAGLVGARRSTTYGEHVTRTFARGLAEREVTVVSGGAYGIDKVAHEATLDAHGDTVLVSAGGLDAAYPPAHDRLFGRVRDVGLLVSESPPGSAPQRRRFLTRNRLIASLSTGTVVVEAAVRSGALNTARHCTVIGRPLMVVPGPVGSAMSAGCHAALRRDDWDARLVTSVAEVLEVVGGIGDVVDHGADDGADGAGRGADVDRTPLARVRRVLDSIDERSRAVFDGFPADRAVEPDELVAAAGLTISEVLRSLPVLELAGLIEQDRDGFRIRG